MFYDVKSACFIVDQSVVTGHFLIWREVYSLFIIFNNSLFLHKIIVFQLIIYFVQVMLNIQIGIHRLAECLNQFLPLSQAARSKDD